MGVVPRQVTNGVKRPAAQASTVSSPAKVARPAPSPRKSVPDTNGQDAEALFDAAMAEHAQKVERTAVAQKPAPQARPVAQAAAQAVAKPQGKPVALKRVAPPPRLPEPVPEPVQEEDAEVGEEQPATEESGYAEGQQDGYESGNEPPGMVYDEDTPEDGEQQTGAAENGYVQQTAEGDSVIVADLGDQGDNEQETGEEALVQDEADPNAILRRDPRYFRNLIPSKFVFVKHTPESGARKGKPTPRPTYPHHPKLANDWNIIVQGPCMSVGKALLWPLGDMTDAETQRKKAERFATKGGEQKREELDAKYRLYLSTRAWNANRNVKGLDREARDFVEWLKEYRRYYLLAIVSEPDYKPDLYAAELKVFAKQHKLKPEDAAKLSPKTNPELLNHLYDSINRDDREAGTVFVSDEEKTKNPDPESWSTLVGFRGDVFTQVYTTNAKGKPIARPPASETVARFPELLRLYNDLEQPLEYQDLPLFTFSKEFAKEPMPLEHRKVEYGDIVAPCFEIRAYMSGEEGRVGDNRWLKFIRIYRTNPGAKHVSAQQLVADSGFEAMDDAPTYVVPESYNSYANVNHHLLEGAATINYGRLLE
jgi:hypothetical protein